jgi:hypothetical protein
MVSVSWLVAAFFLLVPVAVMALCVWAIRRQDRMFPKGSIAPAGNPNAAVPGGS